jgi:predicted membrane protein
MKDKNLLNAAGLVAIILGILECLTIFGAIVGIPSIIGGIKLRELSTMSEEEIEARKDTLLIWSIVLIILCTISGILALIYYVGIENPNLMSSSSTKNNNKDKYDELERINQLYKDKVLTKEEFEKEKERILNQ